MVKEEFTTGSPEETERLGEEFSRRLTEGDIVGLIGELGGGKTRFVRGIAKGIGAKGFIKSPSFTIMNIYEGGRLPLYHIDLYRVGGDEEFYFTGLEEYIYGKGISVIEWADKIPSLIDQCVYIIRLTYLGENERKIEITGGSGKE